MLSATAQSSAMPFPPSTDILQQQAGPPQVLPRPDFSYYQRPFLSPSAQFSASISPVQAPQGLATSPPPLTMSYTYTEVETLKQQFDIALRKIRDYEETSALPNCLLIQFFQFASLKSWISSPSNVRGSPHTLSKPTMVLSAQTASTKWFIHALRYHLLIL
jgi:hypothetical protein